MTFIALIVYKQGVIGAEYQRTKYSMYTMLCANSIRSLTELETETKPKSSILMTRGITIHKRQDANQCIFEETVRPGITALLVAGLPYST